MQYCRKCSVSAEISKILSAGFIFIKFLATPLQAGELFHFYSLTNEFFFFFFFFVVVFFLFLFFFVFFLFFLFKSAAFCIHLF